MEKDLTINGTDAWTAYGVYMDDSSLGQLLAPPPLKDRITSTSRAENGTRVVTDAPVYVAEREITLQLGIYGETEEKFLTNVKALTKVLTESKTITIGAAGDSYTCIYLSCSQFSAYMRGIGKFVLRLKEYNPANR